MEPEVFLDETTCGQFYRQRLAGVPSQITSCRNYIRDKDIYKGIKGHVYGNCLVPLAVFGIGRLRMWIDKIIGWDRPVFALVAEGIVLPGFEYNLDKFGEILPIQLIVRATLFRAIQGVHQPGPQSLCLGH
jgi:hypothetical protein